MDTWDRHACLGCGQRYAFVTRAQDRGKLDLVNTGHLETPSSQESPCFLLARSARHYQPLEPLESHHALQKLSPRPLNLTAERNSKNLTGVASHDCREPKFNGTVYWNSPVGLWPPGTLETQKLATDVVIISRHAHSTMSSCS